MLSINNTDHLMVESNVTYGVKGATHCDENFVWGLQRQEPVALPEDFFQLASTAGPCNCCC